MFSFWYPLDDCLKGFKVQGRAVICGAVNKANPSLDVKMDSEHSCVLSYLMIISLMKSFKECLIYFSGNEKSKKDKNWDLTRTARLCTSDNKVHLQVKKCHGWDSIISFEDGNAYTEFYFVLLKVAPYIIYSSYKVYKYTQAVINELSSNKNRTMILKTWPKTLLDNKEKKILFDNIGCTDKETREILDLHIGLHLNFVSSLVEVSSYVCK